MDYRIKYRYEDFIVNEVSMINYLDLKEYGQYTYFYITKRGISSFELAEHVAKIFECAVSQITFSGLKDEEGITSQLMAVNKSLDRDRTLAVIRSFHDSNLLEMKLLGYSDHGLKIGKLLGNSFKICIRNLDAALIEHMKSHMVSNRYFMPFVNYYDDQRFGMPGRVKNTHKIGEAIIHDDLGRAVDEYVKANPAIELLEISSQGPALEVFSRIEPDKYVFFLNSHMSYHWNEKVEHIIKDNTDTLCYVPCEVHNWAIPLNVTNLIASVGMETEYCYYKYSADGLTVKKSQRKIFDFATLYFSDFDRDEFFDGKYKMSVSFFLNSGQYATMVLKQLMMRLEQEYEKVKLR